MTLALRALYDFVFPLAPRQDSDRCDAEQEITPNEGLSGASKE
jgi:hypothetical protein